MHKPDKSESSALLSPIVSWNVDVSNFAILGEEGLQVLYPGPVGQIVHFQTDLGFK